MAVLRAVRTRSGRVTSRPSPFRRQAQTPAIGVERETVNRYRNGAVIPSYKMMLKISLWSNGKVPLESWREAAE